MKKLMLGLGAALALAFAVQPTQVRADEELVFGPLSVTTVAFSTPVLYTGKFEKLRVVANNTSGNAARSIVLTCTDSAGATMLAMAGVTVNNSANGQVILDPAVQSATNAPTGTTFYTMNPCPYIKVTAAAASGTLKVMVFGRR